MIDLEADYAKFLERTCLERDIVEPVFYVEMKTVQKSLTFTYIEINQVCLLPPNRGSIPVNRQGSLMTLKLYVNRSRGRIVLLTVDVKVD